MITQHLSIIFLSIVSLLNEEWTETIIEKIASCVEDALRIRLVLCSSANEGIVTPPLVVVNAILHRGQLAHSRTLYDE